MQTLRVLAVLFLVGLGIVAYALWGRSGREASTASADPAKTIPIEMLTQLQPVKDIELQYHQPDLPPGTRDIRYAVCRLPLTALCAESAHLSAQDMGDGSPQDGQGLWRSYHT